MPQRIAVAGQRLDRVKLLAIIGGALVAILVAIVSILIIRGIRPPVGLIQHAMTQLCEGDPQARILEATGFARVRTPCHGYNAMADQLQHAASSHTASEQQLQVVNNVAASAGAARRLCGDPGGCSAFMLRSRPQPPAKAARIHFEYELE